MLSNVDKEHFVALDELLSMPIEGAHFARQGGPKRGHWDDGKKHFFYRVNTTATKATFPKGLLWRVEDYLQSEGVPYKLKDKRKVVIEDPDLSNVHADMLQGISMSGIYAYQLDITKAALRAQQGILWLATNSGKTEVAAAIIKALPEFNVLFVVPKKTLLKQARQRIAERLGTVEQEIGIIGDGQFDPRSVTIAIVNSLKPRTIKPGMSANVKAKSRALSRYLRGVQCVFLDEGHHSRSKLWYTFVQKLRGAQFRYLLSGTPFGSGNALMVEAATGPVIARVSNDELITLGVSAKPFVTMLDIPDRVPGASWQQVYLSGVTDNRYRNLVIAKKAAAFSRQGKSTLILVAQIYHGDKLCRLIRAEGIQKVAFVYGDTPMDHVELEKERFSENPGSVLVASPIFDEGVDIPDIRALIIADGGKSPRSVLQKIGRSVRKKKTGSNTVEVIDFADLGHKWLSDHSLERISIYEGEGFDVTYAKPDADGNVAESRTDGQEDEAENSQELAQDVQLSSDSETEQACVQQTYTSGGRVRHREVSIQEISYRMSWLRRAP